MSYATAAELKAWVGGIQDDADDTAIQVVLDAATRNIDRTCFRHFTLESAVTKYFWATNPNSLEVPDLVSITSLTVDTAGDRTFTRTLTSTNYELLPYTDEVGINSVRYQEVRIWPTSSIGFYPGHLTKIVGNFGYVESSTTPVDIKQACLILASRIWKRRESPFGVLSVPDLGTIAQIRKTDPDVASLLEPYVRSHDWVAV